MKTLIKIIFLCGIIGISAFSCEKEDAAYCACGVENPLDKIVWLKNLKTDLTADTEIDSAKIILYDYLESSAFYVHIHKKLLFDTPSPIYNCEGSIIFKVGGNQLNDTSTIFFSNARNPIIIWSK